MNKKHVAVDENRLEKALVHFTSSSGNLSVSASHNTNDGVTIFAGVSKNNAFFEFLNGGIAGKMHDLFIRAINNRTIERNYFRLYIDLLEDVITEEEFNKELEEHEDDYVIQNDIYPSKEDLELALRLSDSIKDVQSSEDISSLFSFNSTIVDELLLTDK